MKNPGLWKRLQSFSVDDKFSELRFVDRLADENGWAHSYAEEAFEEYLKFIYLATVSDKLCTPSDPVDQVWHLHLSYSRSYWEDLCQGLLGRSLHHGPTRGGDEEQARYRDAYAATLDAYRQEFGEVPSSRIWPPVELRFRADEHFQRVNTSGALIVSKRVALIVIAGLVIGSASIAANGDWSTLRGAVGTLGLLLGVPVAFYAGAWVIEKLGIRGGKSRGCAAGGGCSAGCGGGCGGS